MEMVISASNWLTGSIEFVSSIENGLLILMVCMATCGPVITYLLAKMLGVVIGTRASGLIIFAGSVISLIGFAILILGAYITISEPGQRGIGITAIGGFLMVVGSVVIWGSDRRIEIPEEKPRKRIKRNEQDRTPSSLQRPESPKDSSMAIAGLALLSSSQFDDEDGSDPAPVMDIPVSQSPMPEPDFGTDINPSTGLPMIEDSAIDVGGNMIGEDSFSTSFDDDSVSSGFDDSFSSFDTSMGFD